MIIIKSFIFIILFITLGCGGKDSNSDNSLVDGSDNIAGFKKTIKCSDIETCPALLYDVELYQWDAFYSDFFTDGFQDMSDPDYNTFLCGSLFSEKHDELFSLKSTLTNNPDEPYLFASSIIDLDSCKLKENYKEILWQYAVDKLSSEGVSLQN